MAADFALVLHAHLPYVRPTGKEILEERWLYEAVTETYLPLLWSLEQLRKDGIPARLAISLSGPLLSMLGDRGLMARCHMHLVRIRDLAEREAERLAGTPFGPAAEFHRERYDTLLSDFEQRGGDLLAGLRDLQEAGILELFTSAGTHAYLPLLGSDVARRAHIEAGAGEYARHFGHRPVGMWLPECAYAPGLDHDLAAAGVRWFIAETGTVAAAYPEAGGPAVMTPGGVAALARDPQVSRQVWDSRNGYPGDGLYREFYKDAGYELPLRDLEGILVDKIRSDTGLKYYRVTGEVPLDQKQPWNPAQAFDKAREHARHFSWLLNQRSGLVVAPFDAELFGHWWFEGPYWIEMLFRELAASGSVRPVTPTEWLRLNPNLPVARLPAGSWGDGGDNRVWLSEDNDWVWPQVHAAERRLATLLERRNLPAATLNQAVRELLLAESSDWPFILTYHTSADYASKRVKRHLDRFYALADGKASPARFQPEDNIFPTLNAKQLFQRRTPAPSTGSLRLLMLSWEFPPNNVGGLGRHVYDLGSALVQAGHQVQVITLADPGAAPESHWESGMMVSRVTRPLEEGNFLAWTYRANRAMVERAEQAALEDGPFDVIHSHDWLAGQAGMALKARWNVPLVATIHATEKGRNGYVHEGLQQAIHEEEWLLTGAADRVITVSRAMGQEVSGNFRVNPMVIYNGVARPSPAGEPAWRPDGPYFFYIGRLVVEKGVQIAIQALARLERRAHLVVAGKGPMEEELKSLAWYCGVGDRVHFVGRVSEHDKNAWLRHAAGGLVPSLYEPFGIVALEVMAAGVPVVVGDTGGLSEIVTHGQDGLKVYPGNPESLALAMERLLANRDDAAALAVAGRATVEQRFSWPAIAAETANVYRSLLVSPEPVRRRQEELPINPERIRRVARRMAAATRMQ